MVTLKSEDVMANVNALYYAIKGIVSDMKEEDRDTINRIVNDFEKEVEKNKDHAYIALSLLAAKYGVE